MVTYKLAVRIKIELAPRRLFQIYETTRALIRGTRLFVKVGGGGGGRGGLIKLLQIVAWDQLF